MYVEAMLPALLGYQDVVFDRSWLSEVPYGIAFREGVDRLGDVQRRMLERVAFRCGAVVVNCNPGWTVVRDNFAARKHQEMLRDDSQLRMVYDLYQTEQTALPELKFNYKLDEIDWFKSSLANLRPTEHDLDVRSAGSMDGRYILVGDEFGNQKDNDPFYQWPFASFTRQGCSHWLTEKLEAFGVPESKILWVNSDQDLSFIHKLARRKIFALGAKAYDRLSAAGIISVGVTHPQAAKRFGSKLTYDLISALTKS